MLMLFYTCVPAIFLFCGIVFMLYVVAQKPKGSTSLLQRPDQLLKRTQLMERWARWEVRFLIDEEK